MISKGDPAWESGGVAGFLDCRPRRLDGERQLAILRATYELLGEAGYQGLRVDAVAARAKASKATLYRHWPTKAALVADAVRFCKGAAEDMPDTGTLRDDLVAWFGEIGETVAGEEGPIMAGLFMAMHQDAELAAELRSMRDPKTPIAAAICARAEERGELRPGYDAGLIEEIVPGLFFMHHFAYGEALNATFIDHVVDDIVLPLLRQ
jgi:AcrR family transcriptional regulator